VGLISNGVTIPENIANALMVNGVSVTQVIANGVTVWNQQLGPTYSPAYTAYMWVHAYAWSNEAPNNRVIPPFTATLTGYPNRTTTIGVAAPAQINSPGVAGYVGGVIDNNHILILDVDYWTGCRGTITVSSSAGTEYIIFTYLYENSGGAANSMFLYRNGSTTAEQNVGHNAMLNFTVGGVSFSIGSVRNDWLTDDGYGNITGTRRFGLYLNTSYVNFSGDMHITFSGFAIMHTNDGAGNDGMTLQIPILSAS
jgi:hypothetical protein